ncbi:MAG: hypothetical protein Q9191_002974 [Dirinaria sp. TL-2023a]
MEQSLTLMSAHIHFVVSIRPSRPPREELGLTKPMISKVAPGVLVLISTATVSWANQHSFLNVSITPVECSIVCAKELAQQFFASSASQLPRPGVPKPDHATISSEDFVVISVEGEGLEAGQRVLELTSPLALAGISIFFITTYFSDYILVPARSRGQVVRALEERGFTFQESAEAYVNPAAHHHRNKSSTSSLGSPTTPPPRTVSELQTRTFSLLKRYEITPTVDKGVRLVQCAGRRDDPSRRSTDELGLQLGLTKCLIHHPKFLSLTLTEEEPASLLLEKRHVVDFGPDNVLLGNKDDVLIPITLDLQSLPFEATGIVCGVAGKLAGGSESGPLVCPIEMSYLSTARAGTVMVDEKDLGRAMEALQSGDFGVALH